MNFGALIAAAEPRGSGFAVGVPAAWMQGRTAYGGFSSSIALAAARQLGGRDLPPLRSAMINFVGPVTESVEAQPRLLRRGRNAAWIAVDLLCDGTTVLTATFVFMGAIASSISVRPLDPPSGAGSLPSGAPPPHAADAPAFLRMFERRAVSNGADAGGGERLWWGRLLEREGVEPECEILLLADFMPPAALPDGPRVPLSSMTWQVNLAAGMAPAPDGWWLMSSTADFAAAGSSGQMMRMWNSLGQLVASGGQSVAFFG